MHNDKYVSYQAFSLSFHLQEEKTFNADKKIQNHKKPGVGIETEWGEHKTTQDMQSHISLFNGSFVNDFSLFCGFTSKGLLFK